jgi:hypothetical protein
LTEKIGKVANVILPRLAGKHPVATEGRRGSLPKRGRADTALPQQVAIEVGRFYGNRSSHGGIDCE